MPTENQYIIKRTKSKRSKVIWWPFKKKTTMYIAKRRGEPGSVEYTRTFNHEMVHVRQWIEMGRFKFLFKYITRKGRLDIEAEAFATNVKSWHDAGYSTLMVNRGTYIPAQEVDVVDHYTDVIKRQYKMWGVDKEEIKKVLMGYVNEIE